MSRKLERKSLNKTIAVRDIIHGSSFGELLNITTEGLMILVDEDLAPHSIFQLSLQLPEEIEGSTTIELGVDCLWCRKTDNFNRYWAGFHVIDASDVAVRQIEVLIDHYSE